VAGCSGGHIFPAITLASRDYHEHGKRVVFVTTTRPLDQQVVARFPWLEVKTSVMAPYLGIRRPLKLLWCMITSIWDVGRSMRMLYKEKAMRVVSTGGYIALPLALAARIFRIPVVVYELNVEPGKAVMMLAKMGCTLALCFSQTRGYFSKKTKMISASYPLRFGEKDKMSVQEACTRLGISHDKTVLFIVGGSQGSRFFNTLVEEVFEDSFKFDESLYIIHQTGEEDVERVRAYYQSKGIHALVAPFFVDVASCYQAASALVSRAGAGVLAELVFFKCPVAIIPLETIQTAHQKDNALAYAQVYPETITVFEQSLLAKDCSLLIRWLEKRLAKKN